MRFCNSPKLSHEQALKRICWYLKATQQYGLFFTPNLSQGFQCFVDADWAGNWIKSAPNDLAEHFHEWVFSLPMQTALLSGDPKCKH